VRWPLNHSSGLASNRWGLSYNSHQPGCAHRHSVAGGQRRPCVGCRVVAVQLVQPAARAAAAKDVPAKSLNIKLGLDAPS